MTHEQMDGTKAPYIPPRPHDMAHIPHKAEPFPITDESTFRLIGELKVVRGRNGITRLYIDGVYFPFATLDGFHITINRRQLTGITFTLVADSVKVDDTWLAGSTDIDETEQNPPTPT